MDWKKFRRVILITGHFGSGKTELSINLGINLRDQGEEVSLIDLDIINTYFRLREQEKILDEHGIRVYSTGARVQSLDLPALDPAIEAVLLDSNRRVIVDVGGNPSGARALGRYSPVLEETGYDHIFVVNANRPETREVDDVIEFMRRTEDISGTKVSGIFNTSHALKATTVEDVLEGILLAEEVSKKAGVPLIGTACLRKLVDQVSEARKDLFVLPIDLYFRDTWMV